MKYLIFAFIMAEIVIGCSNTQSQSPAPKPVLSGKNDSPALAPVPAEKLDGKVKNAWTFQTADGIRGYVIDVPAKSISTKFLVRVEIIGDVVRSAKVIGYSNNCYGHQGAGPEFTEQFMGKTVGNLKVDAISGATNTCNTVTDAVKKALDFSRTL